VSTYGLHLFPQHAALLEGSAISPEVARERGYVSVDTKKRLEDLGFERYQRSIPGLLIPQRRADGSVWGYQYRPDQPRVTKAGTVIKYETPKDQRNSIDVPAGVKEAMGDPAVPLWVTEGSRKADAAVSAGLACVSLNGVYGWRGRNGRGGRLAVADWHDVALNGRRMVLAFDSDVSRKRTVHQALAELAGYLISKGAAVGYLHLPDDADGKTGLDDHIAAHGADGLMELVRPDLPAVQMHLTAPPGKSATSATGATGTLSRRSEEGERVADSEHVALASATWDDDLAELLNDVHKFLGRFVAYPSAHAQVAHALWIAHTHAMEAWDSTPRIAFLSPEPGSGKTRALEISELLVPRPVEAVNTTPAYLFRKVSDPAGLPTILYDEIDTLFGPRAKDNEEIRGMLNAGHRRGAKAGRCVTRGDVVETEELPAYCPVALAGLGSLPDTLLTRSVVIRMKRRAPGETIEPFRRRMHLADGHAIRDRLDLWATSATATGIGDKWPDLPEGIADRAADVWECLLIIADAAGGDWPEKARVAAVALVADSRDGRGVSLGIRLLADVRSVWDGNSGMHTEKLLKLLNDLDEAPWGDLKGRPLDPRRLSGLLREYEVHPADVRADVDGQEKVRKGYKRDDLYDAWQRYLPPESAPQCTKCGKPLDQSLIDAGFTDHGEDLAA
jgi:Protein of unknown function (DUF3631)/Domain of unknown function (DUF3854)